MKTDIHLRTLSFLVVAAVLALPVTGGAAITGFQFNSLKGIGSECGLDDRIGKTVGSVDHVVNIADCKKFLTCTVELMWSLTRTPASGTEWVVKMSKPGGACTDTDFTTLGTTCLETLVVDQTTIDTPTNITFNFAFSDLVGGSCDTSKDLATKIYIILQEASLYSSTSLPFEIDLKAPAAPVLDAGEEGDSNLKVSWSDPDNDNEAGLEYRVYWASEKFDDATKGSIAKHSDAITGRSYQISDLENGKEYWYGVTAVDKNDNEGPLSAITSGMPVPVLDFYEAYRASPEVGREKGGYCFIATAAYGSYMADEVWTLRAFRDRFLMTWGPGRVLVAAYYTVSPPLAAAIADSEALRGTVRVMLWPVVTLAGLATALPPGWGFLVPLMLILVAFATGFATRAWVRARRRS